MDEVDIDAEDYNELEARLYGQIHHEAVAVAISGEVDHAAQQQQEESVQRIVTTTSVVNRPAGASRVPTSRYWANSVKNTAGSAGAGPTSAAVTAIVVEKEKCNDAAATPKGSEAQSTATGEGSKVMDNPTATESVKPKQPQPPPSSQIHTEKSKNIQKQRQHQQPGGNKSDLRINPVAACRNSKAKLLKKQQQYTPRQGPFKQQELKLEKALQIEAKKQKSKKARAKRKQQQQTLEIITLETSEESADDVIVLPIVAPPIITIDDSDSGECDGKPQIEEENAMDAADVQLEQKPTFSEPTAALKQSTTVSAHETCIEKPVERESLSRCASPCSVLSSDDFIGQTDRSRLLECNGAADDQDLLMLSADVDSMMQPPCVKGTEQPEAEATETHCETTSVVSVKNSLPSNDVVCIGEFATPLATAQKAAAAAAAATHQRAQDYRVEQTQIRALDVYESESDITDTVYSKGASRATTVIRAAGSSSDDQDDDVQQAPASQKLKRLRKRRASGSNRSSEAHNEASTNSEADEDEENFGVVSTGVPFISRGQAVERVRHKVRKRSHSVSARRISGGASGSAGHMSDTEFIATLTNLAHGLDDIVPNDGQSDSDDEDEEETAPALTARDIAERVLQAEAQRTNAVARDNVMAVARQSEDDSSVEGVEVMPSESSFMSDAVPVDVVAGLDKVFESIDNLGMRNKGSLPGEPVDVSDEENISDNDVEIVTSPAVNSMQFGDEPLYNVVYSRGRADPGGIGWNDEMRKFYNSSWGGENFTLRQVQMGMDRNKHLWKIYTEDRFPKGRPFSNLKCYNCCEFGHTRAKCKRPKKPLICYMCGESGHYEPRCPNTICLRCGNKTQIFTKSCNACTFQNRLICPICKVRGHAINLCPDKWRRYHSTTEHNAYPSNRIEYKTRRMCCICGGRGHLSETCRNALRFMEYPIIISEVKSHQKSYSDLVIKEQHTGLAFNLLYKPSEIVSFHMTERTTANSYYGRFLRAVGMGYMLRRKRLARSDGQAVACPSKQARSVALPYKPNPQVRAARAKLAETTTVTSESYVEAPNQVQEVSGSVDLEQDVEMGSPPLSVASSQADVEEVIPSADDAAVDMDITQASDPVDPLTDCVVVDEVVSQENSNGAALSQPDPPNQFKAPSEVPAAHAAVVAQEKDALCLDSDSNYSFSEHFEIRSPPAAASEPVAAEENVSAAAIDSAATYGCILSADGDAGLQATPSTSTAQNVAEAIPRTTKAREMGPLPDFIPLNDANDADGTDINNVDTQSGISRRFVTDDTDDEDDGSPLPDVPCEAKIYLTHFHSNYLLSPKGHTFLVEKSNAFNIKARLDWTSVGHVLVIFGLPSNQNKFHIELLLKYRELSDQMKCERINLCKVPKRTDVLVRFLRDNINQLFGNLGNASDLQRRIQNLEDTQTKASLKLAEKCRRSLNMILLGQAGLCDGNMHLDKLLLSLKKLINDYHSELVVPNQLRDEIDAHSKLIFTSYRHDNYPELIETYNKLLLKNRLPKLNIDPLLLGQKLLDTSLTSEQKERMDRTPQKPPPAAENESADIVLNTFNPNNSKLPSDQQESPLPPAPSMKVKLNSTPPPAAPSMKLTPAMSTPKQKGKITASPSNTPTTATRTKANTPITAAKKQSLPPPPFMNPQQKCTAVTRVKENAQTVATACDGLLTDKPTNAAAPSTSAAGAGGQLKRGLVNAPSKGPSVFWSRESMKYLSECIRLAECNNELLQKLQRIQQKAHSGALSYNDYRAVIKLHGAMLGN